MRPNLTAQQLCGLGVDKLVRAVFEVPLERSVKVAENGSAALGLRWSTSRRPSSPRERIRSEKDKLL